MEFYTYHFFIEQSSGNRLVKYVILVGLLACLLGAILKWFHSRDKMKYRDLIILVSLGLIFLVGIQLNEYNMGKINRDNSSRMINFLDNISMNQKIELDKLAVNSKYVKDEMLIKIDDTYYQINMNPDLSSFKLEETFLLNEQDVRLIEE